MSENERFSAKQQRAIEAQLTEPTTRGGDGLQTHTQPPPPPISYGPPKVIVADVEMPFWSMVAFMIKLAFVSIPAMIIVSVVLGGIFAAILAFLGAQGALGAAAK